MLSRDDLLSELEQKFHSDVRHNVVQLPDDSLPRLAKLATLFDIDVIDVLAGMATIDQLTDLRRSTLVQDEGIESTRRELDPKGTQFQPNT